MKPHRNCFSLHLEPLERRQLMSAGALDPTFGQGGTAATPFGFFPLDMALQADGKSVVIGTKDHHWQVARLNADGSADQTFGGGGLVTTDLAAKFGENAEQVAIEPD